MNLLISQLAALAQGAGFSGDDLAIAVAVALAESGGDPTAYNPERAAGAAQGHGSYGLWQIYLTAHPEYSAVGLIDPQTNAAAAFAVYQAAGNSFRPWSTFKHGDYLAHLDAVNQFLVAASSDSVPTDATGAPLDPTSGSGGAGDGGTLAIIVIGGLLFWAATRIFNG